jgi:hypothetical protein
MKAITNFVLLQAIIITTLSIASLSFIDISWAQPVSGDPPCENYLEREDRFLDRYEADPDNNGKQESFQSSFQNGGPCL